MNARRLIPFALALSFVSFVASAAPARAAWQQESAGPESAEAAEAESPSETGSASSAALALWPAAERERQEALEAALVSGVDPAQLRAFHERLASEPHPSGSPGDARVIESLAMLFMEFGLEVELHPFWAYLAEPVSAKLELLAPLREVLPLEERPIEGDPDSDGGGESFGWNAYSGSGRAEAEVVYANFGRLEDFRQLEKLGVDCRGKIVIARYGGNFRGYKAKYAEEAGAAGLIIYSDPKDAGWGQGLAYPEGGYFNESTIQRGSIKALAYDGDPLTPGREATRAAERLNAKEVGLPSIPVQPIGWGAARRILSLMTGESAPQDWQGGLDFRYRLTGGAELRVGLEVEQRRRLVRSANVIGTLRGLTQPDDFVLLGAHHDAWLHGAADPTCGTITVLEAARVLSLAAEAGFPPARSIRFAGWGAEEHGIIGSVEWVESRPEELREHCIAYFNMDMASMGPNFSSSASPDLQALIAQVALRVPQDEADAEPRAMQHWSAEGRPRFGDMGGGSDHVGFIALAGVPSASLGAGGARGSSYHSAYDTLAWYRRVVGDDYASARLVARMASLSAARLANAPVLALQPSQMGRDTLRHLRGISARGRELGTLAQGEDPIASELAELARAARAFVARAQPLEAALVAGLGSLPRAERQKLDRLLLSFSRAWLDEAGLPGRAWYKNLFAAPDETSGYAAWMLPLLRQAVESGQAEALARAQRRYAYVFEQLDGKLDSLASLLPKPAAAAPSAPSAPRRTDFDALWDYANPAATEARFRLLLPEAEVQGDSDFRAQLLSQIARTHSLRNEFEPAQTCLDEAEALLPEGDSPARVRCLLERGRSFRSAGRGEEARPCFERALASAQALGLEYHAVDAAHMLAISGDPDAQLEWSRKAAELAEACTDERARAWLGPIYNNLGQTLLDRGELEAALEAYTKGLEFRRSRGTDTRIARWCVAHTLRLLGRVDEALEQQLALLHEPSADEDGFVREEIGECLLTLGQPDAARPHFARAHELLSKIDWVAEDPARLERLLELSREP